MKELGEKTGVLVGLDLPSEVGELKQGFNPHIGKLTESEEKHLRLRVKQVWQPKWNENQTVLAAAIHTPDRNAGPLEGTAAGRGSLGTVGQSQGESCH